MFTILGLLVALLLLSLGSHVAVALGLVTAGLILTIGGVPMTVIAQTAFRSVNSYALLAIPMFILAGNLMMRGRIAELMIDLTVSVVRAVRGGLAQTVLITAKARAIRDAVLAMDDERPAARLSALLSARG